MTAILDGASGATLHKYDTFKKTLLSHNVDIQPKTSDIARGSGHVIAAVISPIYIIDVLWCQPIKLIQVASNSELYENQQNDLLFFEIVPCDSFRSTELKT